MNSVLEFNNVTKRYGSKVALDNINMSLPAGSIIGLLGPNGSGKTTLLKLAAGLLTVDEGSVFACGQKPGFVSKELVAYQPDRVYLNDWMRVSDLVSMFADFYGTFNRSKADAMLADLKIDPKEKLKSLSKGTKEKVQLILTMSRDVALYLLDEPIGGVDPAARDYILSTILSNYTDKASVLISTHLITDVEPVLGHVVFLKEGQIVRHGSVDEIREAEGKSIDELFREEFRC
ncbi:MAG: ABC transporter ATP-binding protein [Spirochaetaceae bacterium]|nr:ABC transporter ATP-binding protein [Spirochaetaceae bacterium]MBP5328658.1 ABC transporter ATP-binding protein [Spirochaetaceae bacterium]